MMDCTPCPSLASSISLARDYLINVFFQALHLIINFHRDSKMQDVHGTPHQLDTLQAQYCLLTDKNLKQECIRAALRGEVPHR